MFDDLVWGEVMRCAGARWQPVIGDPNATGWLTVAAYLACAFLALALVRRMAPGRERKFWALMLVLMTFLAINKQLDLQSAVTAVGRCMAQLQGWYQERQTVQREFILGLLVLTVLGLVLGLVLMRRDLRRNGLAILGLAVVAGFVAVRAVGFHDVDHLISTRFQGLRLNFFFEVSGLTLIALNAFALLRRPYISSRTSVR
ncbi:hypothetical protein [Stagnihabitans tardus]|uniref:Uncharacterized protein n=1 Tax=Stagnihabitans tardus TaxID=2699202 RepID=A0AAE5BS49_9RHOB|nr:hypothetical protein [Stagnihabitans tardus]NBZ87380.1 hypothetical protein [Stagnihabitans tardus]